MKRVAALLLGLIAALPAIADTPPTGPFLCITEQSTGFSFDAKTKSWQRTRFESGEKLILKRVTNKPGSHPIDGTWAVWHFGQDDFPWIACKDEFNAQGYLFCGPDGQSMFSFNATNHRFISAYLVGYIQGSGPAFLNLPEGSDTPFINIGTCAAL